VTDAPDPIDYLDAVAASDHGRRYKHHLHASLDIGLGHAVLDVGCGPGTDLATFADAVGPGGLVIGVDHDPRMVEDARRRLAGRRTVEIRAGDAHALPIDDGSVDRACADRVIQHLAEPAAAISEMRRVVRPGGLIGAAEPDWDTLAIDDPDGETSRAFTRFLADVQVRNGTIGRHLARLMSEQGLDVRTVNASVALFREFAGADAILGLHRNVHRAVTAGDLAAPAAEAWLRRLENGPFLAAVTMFSVTAQVP
jgi:ubiquinone/menaquinone biosynthesis C-methylase UbiE